jgi:proline dehydrogenase
MALHDTHDVKLTIATHNMDSVMKAAHHLQTLQFDKQVSFAQINGLADHLSITMARRGFKVLKLVPCGSVEDVLPWLARYSRVMPRRS